MSHKLLKPLMTISTIKESHGSSWEKNKQHVVPSWRFTVENSGHLKKTNTQTELLASLENKKPWCLLPSEEQVRELNSCCPPSGGIGAPLFAPVLTQPSCSSDVSRQLSLWPWGYMLPVPYSLKTKPLHSACSGSDAVLRALQKGGSWSTERLIKLSEATQQKCQR